MAVFVLCVQDYRERYVYGDIELIRQSNVRVRSMPATVKVDHSVLVDMVIRELLLSTFTVPGNKI